VDVYIALLIISGFLLLVTLVLLHRSHKKRDRENKWELNRDSARRQIALLRSQYPLPSDQRACNLIEKELKAVSRKFSMNTSISPKKVYEMATGLTQKIAAIYHPDTENPALKASLSDLLQLNERIVTRLNLKIQEFPLNAVKDISIHKIMAGKGYYESKIKNKLEWLKKYKTFYNLGSHAWLSYNVLNPWYWGRKIAYTSAREITFRYLLTWIITIVGEEAMAVYSRRDINTLATAFERDLAFAMADMACMNRDISGKAYAVVLDHVLNKARLNDTVRVSILRALKTGRSVKEFAAPEACTKNQARRMLTCVKRVAEADGEPGPEMHKRLAALESALATVSNPTGSRILTLPSQKISKSICGHD